MKTSIDQITHTFSERLVTLCDGRLGLRGGLVVETRTPDSGTKPVGPVLEFIASSEALDRFDEIIAADGWQLDNYRRNPVFQNAHQYGDVIFTLGKALVTEVRALGGRPVLYQQIEFAVDANPMARIAYGLYRGKFLNAVSVGFIPIRWQDADDQEYTRGLPGSNAELCSAVSPSSARQAASESLRPQDSELPAALNGPGPALLGPGLPANPPPAERSSAIQPGRARRYE